MVSRGTKMKAMGQGVPPASSQQQQSNSSGQHSLMVGWKMHAQYIGAWLEQPSHKQQQQRCGQRRLRACDLHTAQYLEGGMWAHTRCMQHAVGTLAGCKLWDERLSLSRRAPLDPSSPSHISLPVPCSACCQSVGRWGQGSCTGVLTGALLACRRLHYPCPVSKEEGLLPVLWLRHSG